VGAAGETPTMGVAVESRADAHSTSRLAHWFIVGTRAGVAPLGECCGRAFWPAFGGNLSLTWLLLRVRWP
jgi:hypothetical protein